jgi:hypothetical protein
MQLHTAGADNCQINKHNLLWVVRLVGPWPIVGACKQTQDKEGLGPRKAGKQTRPFAPLEPGLTCPGQAGPYGAPCLGNHASLVYI